MAKNKTRLEKSTETLKDSIATQWCYVNTDNEFNFMSETFVIDENVEQYKVHNKAGTVENYTNESYMEEILVVIDKNRNLSFYDQNYDLIDSRLVVTE